ncbi:MAG TPA: GNAT family N-acetyltransferase [Longimicrobium sp.]
MQIDYAEEPDLPADDFLGLAQRVWPGDYAPEAVQAALGRTINLTARVEGALIGCVRILTDGYFFGTVPEILVHPGWQGRGIGRALMERAWERSPTGLFFGAQPGNEPFFEKLGYERSMAAYARRKPRPRPDSPPTPDGS